MTVERLVELLQREYPQALVSIAAPKSASYNSCRRLSKYDLLEPYGIGIVPRTGAVHIICERHDC